MAFIKCSGGAGELSIVLLGQSDKASNPNSISLNDDMNNYKLIIAGVSTSAQNVPIFEIDHFNLKYNSYAMIVLIAIPSFIRQYTSSSNYTTSNAIGGNGPSAYTVNSIRIWSTDDRNITFGNVSRAAIVYGLK